MWTSVMRNTDPMLKLRASDFRRSFTLGELELLQLEKYGWMTIRSHAEKIVRERLGAIVEHDTKQTPLTGHPVFVAQHATATCCRRCLFKWHRIPLFRDMTDEELRQTTALILRWISGQEDRARTERHMHPAIHDAPPQLVAH